MRFISILKTFRFSENLTYLFFLLSSYKFTSIALATLVNFNEEKREKIKIRKPKCFKYIILFLFCFQLLSSQNKTDFNLNKQFYVNGDAMIIGNNILSKYKKKSFNETSIVNDQVKMKYIDIDNDNDTFSSSQATLNLPKKAKKILSATLYWSAIYSFSHGIKKQKGSSFIYKGNGKRDSTINKIKFKTPNSTYQNIEGTILSDKFNPSKFKDNSPYVCYADVTDIINKSQNQNGPYTIANIKATQDYTTGGSAGGWLLYVVFETTTDKPKYISAYHGLVTIHKNPLDVKLKDFKTVKNGIAKASLTLSALEGDRSLGKDQCLIYNKTKETFIPLENKLRSGKNFFNSSITINSNKPKDRLPNSINTLGFDIVEMDIPNKNNELIPNGATSMTLRLKTKSDRFHLFFVAFKTELEDVFYKDKKVELALAKTIVNNTNIIDDIIITDDIIKTNKIGDKNNEEVLESTKKGTFEKKIQKPELKEELIAIDTTKIITIKKNINIDGLEPGYYIISNVFSNLNYAKKWESFLKNKSHKLKTFINSKNKWHYISIYNSLDESKAKLKLIQFKKNTYFKGLWLQKINL